MILVLIASHNNPAAVYRCQNSLWQSHLDAERIEVLTYENSVGYTKGMNHLLRQALARGDAKYAVLVNQDATVDPHAIWEAFEFMENRPRCAILGFKQLNPENPDEIVHGGTGSADPGFHIGGTVSNGNCNVSKPFAWVNGAVEMVRLDFVRQCGVMDEQFVCICQDSDWCYTAWKCDWEVWYCAQAIAYHGRGGMSTSTDETPMQQKTDDMRRWRQKWAGLRPLPISVE